MKGACQAAYRFVCEATLYRRLRERRRLGAFLPVLLIALTAAVSLEAGRYACTFGAEVGAQAPVPAVTAAAGPAGAHIPFRHYGWVYTDYTEGNAALTDMASYTKTITAGTVSGVIAAWDAGFREIVFAGDASYLYQPLEQLLKAEGRSENVSTFDFRAVVDYRTRILSLYEAQLRALRRELLARGAYDKVGMFFLVDEPALHRNYIVDSSLLDAVEYTFKAVFPDKQSMMSFAEDAAQSVWYRGRHLPPPPGLDAMLMTPYFSDNAKSCDRKWASKWLYELHPHSAINWAFQWNKAVFVAGDAMIRGAADPLDCYLKNTFDILKSDTRIAGLMWFAYDPTLTDGPYTGAGNSAALVSSVKRLTALEGPQAAGEPPRSPAGEERGRGDDRNMERRARGTHEGR